MKRAFYIIAYDIVSEKRRRKIREAVQSCSLDAQKSVFECWLSENELQKLINSISPFLAEEDKCHMYKANQLKSKYLGKATITQNNWVIIH